MAVTIHTVRSNLDERIADQSKNFERLFQENWERVFKVLYRMVGDPDEAQDLALEVFWKLHSHPPRDMENVNGWLYRVAMRLGYNALRAYRRRAWYEQQAGMRELMSNTDDPQSTLDLTEKRAQVRRVLAGMRPRSAKILLLRYSGFSYAEIGSILKIPLTSVGTLLTRAAKDFEKRYLQDVA